MCMYMHMCAVACRGQKMDLDPLKLEFQMVLMWILWTEL